MATGKLVPDDHIFKIVRDYVEHEDDLIHQRLNWMLLLQGFLFSSFATLYASLIKSIPGSDASLRGLRAWPSEILYVLPILGFFIAWFSLSGVMAARQAIDELNRWWERNYEQDYFPSIIGGGQNNVTDFDTGLHYGIPLTLCIAWLVLGSIQLCHNDHRILCLLSIVFGAVPIIRPTLLQLKREFLRFVGDLSAWLHPPKDTKTFREEVEARFNPDKSKKTSQPPVPNATHFEVSKRPLGGQQPHSSAHENTPPNS